MAKPFAPGALFIIALTLFTSCKTDKKQFDILSSVQTGITFNPLSKKQTSNDNEIKEFGNAVAVGDLNNDGLPDLIFGGMYANPEVYLNQGGLQFKNITTSAGIKTAASYNSYGTAIIDINNDGWNDIYICANGRAEGTDTTLPFHNLLYINQGNSTFKEKSADYNLNISGHCYMPYFFDYDKDNDADLFLLIFPDFAYNPFDITYMQLAAKDTLGAHSLLLENRAGKFYDVTSQRGIALMPATTNSCIIADVNTDGWPDIYVANDFIFPDQLYINHSGYFTNESKLRLAHTTMFSMGADCADINNDLYPDIVVADMLSPGHFRRKMNTLPLSTGFYDLLKEQAFPQYQHNAIQLNNEGKNFSESAFFYNTAATEWSWSPLLADFDNDGYKDLFVTAGSRKELTNLDYLSNFGNESGIYNPIKQWMLDWNGIPKYTYHNYIYKNINGNYFNDKTSAWGIDKTTNSEGAAYADFDNDGDIDVAICNTNCAPYILRNNNNTLHPAQKYLRISLHAINSTNYATGTKVYLFKAGKSQMQEAINTKGYLAMSESMIHFGVDTASIIDSIKVCWPSGKQQTLHHITSNKVIEVFEKNATDNSVFTPLQKTYRIIEAGNTDTPFVHHEDDFNDFKRDKIIPHRVSRQGPAIAVADINNDGLEDYYVSGAKNQAGALYVQTAGGDFQLKQTAITKFTTADDETVAIWADLDKNGLPDLITGIGSNAASGDDTNHLHVAVYYNKGNLLFEQEYKLPAVKYPVGSISAADIDNDGDMDVFVGCRIVPGAYGVNPRSYLFENRGTYFADITSTAPGLQNAGMITASAFADLDGDKKTELIIAGEFMPVTIYKNTKTGWQNVTTKSGLGLSNGLWNCIKIADINNDGHPDILGGNWGDNSIWLASTTEPLSLWVNDFDGNGSTDPILFHYLNGVNAPFVNRDLFCKQMPKFFNVFNNYESYARCTDKNIFDATVRAKTVIKYVYTLNSTLFLNDGKGNFTSKILPPNSQLAPISTFVTYDFDHNGTIDLIPLGNTNSNFYDQGDIDALRGKIFSGDGQGNFDNGTLVPDMNNKTVINSSAVISNTKTKTDLILVGVNNDTMKTYVILKPAQ